MSVDGVAVQLGIKITYNLNDSPQLRLARHPPTNVTIYPDSDSSTSQDAGSSSRSNYVGSFAELPLKTCVMALTEASPELLCNVDVDYSVYVNDPTEAADAVTSGVGVLVGKGLLSSVLSMQDGKTDIKEEDEVVEIPCIPTPQPCPAERRKVLTSIENVVPDSAPPSLPKSQTLPKPRPIPAPTPGSVQAGNKTPFVMVPALQPRNQPVAPLPAPVQALAGAAPTTYTSRDTRPSTVSRRKYLMGPHGNGWYRRSDLPPPPSSDPPSAAAVASEGDILVVKDNGKNKKRLSDTSDDGARKKRRKTKASQPTQAAMTSPVRRGSKENAPRELVGNKGRPMIQMAATSPIRSVAATTIKRITLKTKPASDPPLTQPAPRAVTESAPSTEQETPTGTQPEPKIRTLNFLSLMSKPFQRSQSECAKDRSSPPQEPLPAAPITSLDAMVPSPNALDMAALNLPPSSPPSSFASSSPSVSPRFTLDSVVDGIEDAPMEDATDVDTEQAGLNVASVLSDSCSSATNYSNPPTSDAVLPESADLAALLRLCDSMTGPQKTLDDVWSAFGIDTQPKGMEPLAGGLGLVEDPGLGGMLAGSDLFDFEAATAHGFVDETGCSTGVSAFDVDFDSLINSL
ncbi:hypothetical protein FRB99_005019 [Tulasnella sp. 403]|nr:hypothetical protein FRB99_005019 [Tulasnella sp. 403]